MWVDPDGRTESLKLRRDAYNSVRVDSRGSRIVYDVENGSEAGIWIYELTGRSPARRLTAREAPGRHPIWSRDGRHVVFESTHDGKSGLFRQAADGSGSPMRLTTATNGVRHIPESWSPVAEDFLFSALEGGSSATLWVHSMKDSKSQRVGNLTSLLGFNAEYAPTGDAIAYTLRRPTPTGIADANIWIAPYPWTGDSYQITTENGHHPIWLRDGRLSYRVGGFAQEVLGVTLKPAFSMTNPQRLVGGNGLPLVPGGNSRTYDLLPDGRVIAIENSATNQLLWREIHIVENWFHDLRLVSDN